MSQVENLDRELFMDIQNLGGLGRHLYLQKKKVVDAICFINF
jgi:hypothetical protein